MNRNERYSQENQSFTQKMLRKFGFPLTAKQKIDRLQNVLPKRTYVQRVIHLPTVTIEELTHMAKRSEERNA